MATLKEISELLGYTEDISFAVPISPSRMLVIDTAITDLARVETALRAVVTDGMARAVGDIQLDYGRHRALLMAEGSRLIKTISIATEVPPRYNKYSTTRTISFKNYY
jgi:hypothetical protein